MLPESVDIKRTGRAARQTGPEKTGGFKMFGWKGNHIRLLGTGILLGSYGVKLLKSQDMKKLYTQGTAAVLRMKDEVLRDVTLLRENCEDIAADAREINEQRQAAFDAKQIEDAKELLAAAESDASEDAPAEA